MRRVILKDYLEGKEEIIFKTHKYTLEKLLGGKVHLANGRLYVDK